MFDEGTTIRAVRLAAKRSLPKVPHANLKDILNALLVAGALLGADGTAIGNAGLPINALSTRNHAALETLCVHAYAKAILRAAPEWFDTPVGRREFMEVVGKRAPNQGAIDALRAQIAT